MLLYLKFYAFIILRNLDTGYLATVLIGTPPNPFNVLVDSGSADFWVGGEQCKEVQIVRKLPQATKKDCVSFSISI